MNEKFFETAENLREGGVLPSLVAKKGSFTTSYSIDYLTFSFPFEFRYPIDAVQVDVKAYSRLSEVLKALYLTFESMEETFPSNGFKYAYQWRVPVEYAGEKNPCTRLSYYLVSNELDIGNIEMTGACCRDLERRYRTATGEIEIDDLWHDLLEKIVHIQGAFSRIDIAFDLFDVPEEHGFVWFYKKIYLERAFSSPIGYLDPKIPTDDRNNTYDEQTLTIGKSGSQVQICIYNKKLEQLQQGKRADFNSWVRIEIRFKKERANAFVAGLLNDWDKKTDYCVGVLKHYLQIKEKPKGYDELEWTPRKVRKAWKTDPFWEGLFEDTEKVKLVHLEDQTTIIQKRKKYANVSLSGFLSTIRYSMTDDAFRLFIDLISKKGVDGLKVADIELINYDRLRNGLEPLEEEDLKNVRQCLEKAIDDQETISNRTQVGEIDPTEVELKSLDKQIKKYKKVKDRDEFLKVVKNHIGDRFEDMSEEELNSLISGILMFYKREKK